MVYVDCSASNNENYTYTLNEPIDLTIPACLGDLSTTTATLTAIGTPTPPEGFAVLAKNTDGSWKITISSHDSKISGLVYTYALEFYDSSGTYLIQSSSP